MNTILQNTWTACHKPKKKPYEETDKKEPSE